MSDELTGRELDAAIAERCLRKTLTQDKRLIVPQTQGKTRLVMRYLPRYSENMDAAWQVAEWIRAQTNVFYLAWDNYQDKWLCTYIDTPSEIRWAKADTAEEAICRAALKLADQLAESTE